MRLARITISLGLGLGAVALSATVASAAKLPCPSLSPSNPSRLGRCGITVSSSGISAAEPAAIAGRGFQPGSAVAVSLGSSPAAAVMADGDGQFRQSIVVPKGLAAGQYDIRATGVGVDGAPYEQTAVVQVLATPLGASPFLLGNLRRGAGLAAGGTANSSGSATASDAARVSTSSGGVNPLAGVGGGLAVAGLGAGAVVVARRRKTLED